ncbi:MAG: hypothetical protein GX220_07415 [Treponema sp.]|nr:hypothetical protein [Treponema sp.]
MCWKCGKDIDKNEQIFRTSTCSICGSDLHCCRNCKFYSPGSYYDCHETVDELVQDKEKSNFCDYFKVMFSFEKSSKFAKEKAKAKDAFAALFGE